MQGDFQTELPFKLAIVDHLPLKRCLLGGRFGYFSFFLVWGGAGESEAPGGGGGGGLFIENHGGGGGVLPGGGRGPRGQEGMLGIFGGGGAKYFFYRAEIPTKLRATLAILSSLQRCSSVCHCVLVMWCTAKQLRCTTQSSQHDERAPARCTPAPLPPIQASPSR